MGRPRPLAGYVQHTVMRSSCQWHPTFGLIFLIRSSLVPLPYALRAHSVPVIQPLPVCPAHPPWRIPACGTRPDALKPHGNGPIWGLWPYYRGKGQGMRGCAPDPLNVPNSWVAMPVEGQHLHAGGVREPFGHKTVWEYTGGRRPDNG